MVETKETVSITRADDTNFESGGLLEEIVYRDLGVREATGGRYSAHIMRANTSGRKVPRHFHKVDFQMAYVLKGWTRMWFEGRGEVTLKEGDCFVTRGGTPHEVYDWSDDFELLQVTSPAEYETVGAPAE